MNNQKTFKGLRLAALGLVAVAAFTAGCSDVSTELKTPVYKTKLTAEEIRNSAFKPEFPKQYASYERNDETTVMTEYKGSVPFNKNDNVNPLPEGYRHAQPYLKNLWLGYPFMYEYREARGHTYAIQDFLHIDRINRYAEKGGLPATCWNCKTPKMMEWVKENGDGFWAKDVNEFRDKIDMKDHTIGCATCHDPQTMELRITSVPLTDYLVSQGKDPKKLPRNEMRALVCGQCHVEYYFNGPTMGVNKKPVFPWAEGFDPADMYRYYDKHGDLQVKGFEGKFADWTHPASKTPMLKAQHPEYETWINGTHGAAGVTCADCHMSYTRSDDKKKISSHWWTSPMKDPEMRACRQCHSDKTPDYLKSRVLFTQKRTFDLLLAAQEVSVKAHEAVRLANEYQGAKAAGYDDLMIQAREMVRKGQFFWDYVSAENSVGFHNPAKALDTLAQSQQFSQKAIDLAMEATQYGIGKDLTGDIKTIVPPILKMNRKLQQDPEFMKTHKWFQYLPVLPKADQVWDGQKRLVSAKQ
ncbi:ammonia-forming cytochrome c nitrite reductase subunit c552 [Nitratidesulfovibrio vulgaris]|uniref:ammonia-forming cytochrome c nitrite reductase subunit c552 n=1 Tax=Nitratidesulfovibrio vulgaris TaxID=881 RepID=UPI00230118E9|nr:ammonia-forming cytochrome c nitrite reductase subunit c552 [Nitratidesulfovibrio vulgaris]WCB46216.1 ammonia-forming cytochrome c nitrite reductase subunit c552 [Nitratidesulfovibrio vulgaris]